MDALADRSGEDTNESDRHRKTIPEQRMIARSIMIEAASQTNKNRSRADNQPCPAIRLFCPLRPAPAPKSV